jgi:hypothetical protein
MKNQDKALITGKYIGKSMLHLMNKFSSRTLYSRGSALESSDYIVIYSLEQYFSFGVFIRNLYYLKEKL